MAPVELNVLLLRSPRAGEVESLSLCLPAGSTVAAALAHAGWSLAPTESLGLWGRKVGADEVLTDGDRVEIYRPLTVDPMQARHRRHALQGGRRIVSRHRPVGSG